MKPYEFTSAQWLIAALALLGAECSVELKPSIIFPDAHETSHAEERSKNLKYKQIISIH
jgi:hypothetical protein